MEFGETANRFGLARVFGQNLGKDRRRCSRVAFGGRFLSLTQKHRRFALDRPDEPLDEAADLAFRQRADKSVHRLALVEGDDGWNRLDAELPRDLGGLVDVHLDQRNLATRVGDSLLQRRRELLAWPAPRRPEIDQNRLARRRRQDIGAERGRRDLLDRTRLGLRRKRAADIRHSATLQPGGRPKPPPCSTLPLKWRLWAFYSTGGSSGP